MPLLISFAALDVDLFIT